ncbi:MAG: hypothetical protein LBV11_03020 [Bacillus cereus]|jgi:hypothetical protein|nr:hypothetical protein [Bacillus cereus]
MLMLYLKYQQINDMKKYISTWNKIEQLTFLLDDDGDNLSGFHLVEKIIKEQIKPEIIRYDYSWEASKLYFTKDNIELELEYSGWIGIALRVSVLYTEEQLNVCEKWARLLYDEIKKMKQGKQ